MKQLADFNGLNSNSGLFVGQKLSLKDTGQSKAKVEEIKKAETAKVQTKSYTVKRGEYLKLIADRYGLSNAELASLTSGLTAGSSLMVGQKINVPLQEVEELTASSQKTEQKFENVKVDQTATENYQVKRGETLYTIASQSKLSVSELAALNGLSANSGLRIGQTIKIPAGSQIPETYTVQSGDTLTGIASRYNLSMDQVASLNGMSRNAGLRVGQRLKLSGDVTEPVSEVVAETAVKNTKSDSHVVKSGETLSSIARQYHLQLQYMADLNGLNTNSTVRIGQRLKIEGDFPTDKKVEGVKVAAKPVASKATESYTVKSGESLNAIASRLGISVTDLAQLNNLSPRAGLRVSQTIQIPKLVTDYKVKRGDTLIGLASRYGLNSNELAEMNDLKPNTQLRIGDVIKVPN